MSAAPVHPRGSGVLLGPDLFASDRPRARWNRGVTAPALLVSNMSKERAAGGGEGMPYGIVGIVVIVILVIVVLQLL